MDLDLNNKRALITGGSLGIGRASAIGLAAEGCRIAINGRDESRLRDAADLIEAETSHRSLILRGDMSIESDVDRVVSEALEAFGGIDILVTCAGTSPGGELEELTDADWLLSLGSKFLGYVRACRAVIPHMRANGGGSVVLVVGNAGLKPFYPELVAGVSNAANINFASAIADEYGRDGVRVNTVNPGPVNTQRWDGAAEELAERMSITSAQAEKLIIDALPLGRIAEPEEIASLVTFLSSSRASYINGAHILIDGGQRKAIMDHSRTW